MTQQKSTPYKIGKRCFPEGENENVLFSVRYEKAETVKS